MRRNSTQSLFYFIRWQVLPAVLALPAHLGFISRGLRSRRCGLQARLQLASYSLYIHLRLECGHNPAEILSVIEEIVELDPAVQGQVLECGAYLGGSTAKLSRAAALAGRKLIVCDSFQGLPQVGSMDFQADKSEFHTGEYHGTLEIVQRNIQRFGQPGAVAYLPGWYEYSLSQLEDVPVACGFWDVDLQESFRACLLGLWRNIQPGSKVFIHDADRKAVVEVFTDADWWCTKLHTAPPELVGAYTGLGPGRPLLGYFVKDGES